MKVYLPNPKFIFSVLIHAVIYCWDVKLWGSATATAKAGKVVDLPLSIDQFFYTINAQIIGALPAPSNVPVKSTTVTTYGNLNSFGVWCVSNNQSIDCQFYWFVLAK